MTKEESNLLMRAVPQMDILKTQKLVYNCVRLEKPICDGCTYQGTERCKERLMLEAAHALTLLLEEREGKPLMVVGERKR